MTQAARCRDGYCAQLDANGIKLFAKLDQMRNAALALGLGADAILEEVVGHDWLHVARMQQYYRVVRVFNMAGLRRLGICALRLVAGVKAGKICTGWPGNYSFSLSHFCACSAYLGNVALQYLDAHARDSENPLHKAERRCNVTKTM
jgi:hypothetical protein